MSSSISPNDDDKIPPSPQPRHSTRGDVKQWDSILLDALSSAKTATITPPEFIPIYIRDANYYWLPAHILTIDTVSDEKDGDKSVNSKRKATVKIKLPPAWKDETVGHEKAVDSEERVIQLKEYAGGELPIQNVDGLYRLVGRSDMKDLPMLHEAGLLYNLKDRHARGMPYTKVGDIVIATNPFHWIDGLYSEETQQKYADWFIWNSHTLLLKQDDSFTKVTIEPHIYEISSVAYKGISLENKNQSILVTGESGAGKTESIKLIINHLAYIQVTRPGADASSAVAAGDTIVKRVQRSGRLFEAFGNAMTLRNDNSSRFGKFTELLYNVEDKAAAGREGRYIPLCTLAGSTMKTYLLEKTRVVGHDLGERSFHVFYQMLSAGEDVKKDLWEEGLGGADWETFRYLIDGRTVADIPPEDEYTNGEAWVDTYNDLELFGMGGDGRRSLLRGMCCVLQLGNIQFGPDPANDENSVIVNVDELEKAARIFGMDVEVLNKALTKRKMKVMKEYVDYALRPDVAKDNCDALAKEIYARLFDCLVDSVNKVLSEEVAGDDRDNYGIISLLDIFGFELFKVNRYEQFCINYANEKLQNKYVTDVVFSVQVEYEEEGVSLFDSSKVDNSAVLDLIEGKTGLIALLNDECIRPKGNANTLVYKVKSVYKSSPHVLSERLHRPWEFGVKHFASPVKYDASKFIERNMDILPKDLVDCACHSTNPLILDGFEAYAKLLDEQEKKGRSRTRSAKNSVTSKFQKQLNSLLKSIGDARTWYIRCIKPNMIKKHFALDHIMTISQLRSACVETAIVITRETFVNDLPFDHVVGRFGKLSKSPPLGLKDIKDMRGECHRILAELLEGRERVVADAVLQPFECGKTKVFFRAGMLEVLEAERERVFGVFAIVIQRWVRAFVGKRRFLRMKVSIVQLQAYVRGMLARRSYRKQIASIIQMQCWVRCINAKRELILRKILRLATFFQSTWRMYKCRVAFVRKRNAAIRLQKFIKKHKDKLSLSHSLADIVKRANMNRRLNKLRKDLADVDESQLGEDHSSIVNECKEVLTLLKYDTYHLHKENSLLRDELIKEKAKTSLGNQLMSSKVKIVLLTKTNETLRKQISELNDKNDAKKADLKDIKEEMQNQAATHKQELEDAKLAHTKEVTDMKQVMKSNDDAHLDELAKLRAEMARMKKDHEREVKALIMEHQRSTEKNEMIIAGLMDAVDNGVRDVENISMGRPSSVESMSLRNLGAEMKEGRFCGNCGAPIDEN